MSRAVHYHAKDFRNNIRKHARALLGVRVHYVESRFVLLHYPFQCQCFVPPLNTNNTEVSGLSEIA